MAAATTNPPGYGRTTPLPSGITGASITMSRFYAGNHPLCRESTASRRSRHPTDILPEPRPNSMASLGKPATIRQRLTSFNTQTQGSRLHPAEKIGSRFCRAPEQRRSSPLCPMTATMARCSRPRLTKLTVPIPFTIASRARAGDSS